MKQKENTPLGDGEELNQKLSELSLEEMEKIVGGTAGMHLTAKTAGVLGQVAGFTIPITGNTDENNKAGTPQP